MARAHRPDRRVAAWPKVVLRSSPLRTFAWLAMNVAFRLLGGATAFGYFDIIQPGSR
jgi:hypothetical protein